MAIHGKNTGIVLGARDVTRWCNEVTSDQSQDTADASCFDEPDGAKVYVLGMRDTKFTYSAREQGTPDSLRKVANDIAATDMHAPFMVGIDRGFHPGRITQMGNVLVAKVGLSAPISDVVQLSGDIQADGAIYAGRTLSAKAPYGASAPGATVDHGVAAASRVQYHVTDNDRNGQAVLTVQHSADGSTWIDYDTLTVAAGTRVGVVHDVETDLLRYVRVNVSLAGSTGSVTVRAAIAGRS